MYKSFITNEIFENEHDEKMTRKFSYNYQVLKRLFPEVYKLPESEIRSLVRSIYDNPKMGDELLDHLSDVINKRKPEWGEYLNPKPEEPEQTAQPVQQNPLQPVQPKPLNTSSGFEPYKPQKSAFGLDNTNNFGINNSSGLNQSQLPNFSKDMDLKHSDMVTGFGINENKQKEMFGTGFKMPKLPKMPTFPKAPEPEQPQMPRFAPTPAPQFQQTVLNPQFQQMAPAPYFPQTETAYSTYASQTPMAWAQQAPRNISAAEALADKYIGWLPEYKTLKDAKSEMEYINQRGYDNYAHRLAMCRIGQMGSNGSMFSPSIGMGLGILKEISDAREKIFKQKKPIWETIVDSFKDLGNNYEGMDWGINNPNGDCRKWLGGLDLQNNQWNN